MSFSSQDINGILSGYSWAVTNLTVSFPTDASYYGSDYGKGEPYLGFHSVSTAQQSAVRYALKLVSQYTLLTFTEITETDTAHGNLRFADTSTSIVPTSEGYLPIPTEGGDVWFGNIAFVPPTKGSYAFSTILHEIGHALGLKHGQESDPVFGVLPAEHMSTEWSVMTYYSYIGGTGFYENADGSGNQTYMIDDIAALQYMYGANFNTNAGNTVYTWSPTTGETFINGVGQGASSANKVYEAIWDGGGIDTYNLSNYSTNLLIQLEPGEWSTFSGAQLANLDGLGIHLAAGNVANSYLYNDDPRSLIENAIGGTGNDTLMGNLANNALTGGAGNDLLMGYEGNDTLAGMVGNDTLSGGVGNDVLNGGAAGSDTAAYTDSGSAVSVSLALQGSPQNTIGAGTDTLSNIENLNGSNFNDTLTGDANANVLDGLAGNDKLSGNAGNDTLIGEAGNDTMSGGAGNDKLTGLTGDDSLNGGTGNDSMDGGAAGNDTASYADAPAAVTVSLARQGAAQNTIGAGVDTLSNFENLTGSAFNDTLTGDSKANMLNGLAGNDTLNGGLGNDVMDGGAAGSDTASYADAGTAVSVSLAQQGSAQDTVGAGTDTLTNFENLTGSARNDTLTGDGNGNILSGLAGNDVLTGNAGNDTLMGGAGSDMLFGNAGTDSFVFDAGFGKDTIADFTATGPGHDKINFSTAMFANYASVWSHMAQVGPNVVITHDGANAIIVKGVTVASLTAADFTFHASSPNQPAAAPAAPLWADHSAQFNTAAHFG